MRLVQFLHASVVLALVLAARGKVLDRQPLGYAQIPDNSYVSPSDSSKTSLLEFINSREDLSALSKAIQSSAGFAQAFATDTNWDYTFFAPSNTAFNNTGLYFQSFLDTPKGKWWMGNLLQHHYVPNSKIRLANFSTDARRMQTGSFLYLGTQLVNDKLVVNRVAQVTEGDIDVTNGVVHIVDHILSPEAQIFEADIQKVTQSFIPGSCSNTSLRYC